jgi:hexosaminidase
MRHPFRSVVVLCALALCDPATSFRVRELQSALPFWPQPASASLGNGKLHVSPRFGFACAGTCPPTLQAAFNRAVPAILGVPALQPPPAAVQEPKPGAAVLSVCVVSVASNVPETPAPDGVESYVLRIAADGGCNVTAPTLWGALHALTTLAQAASGPPGDARVLRGVPLLVDDAPRFRYRGLLLDSARHYLPLPSLLRTLDAMSATKLNVLHWHLTDAESFPLALPGFEDLAAAAAWHPRAVYTPGDVAAVVEHARARGIRVVPEIDVPGHGSWRARPELLACDDTLDPTKNEVYAFLARFLRALTALFPDPYVFLGGDEVDVQACWAANAAIADWLVLHNMTAAHLQPYFWRRVWAEVLPALQGANSTRIPGVWLGADEAIPLSELPARSFVNAWQGTASLAVATRAGVRVRSLVMDIAAVACTRLTRALSFPLLTGSGQRRLVS